MFAPEAAVAFGAAMLVALSVKFWLNSCETIVGIRPPTPVIGLVGEEAACWRLMRSSRSVVANSSQNNWMLSNRSKPVKVFV